MDLGNCDGDLLYLSASKRHKLNISLFWEIFLSWAFGGGFVGLALERVI